MCRNCSSNQHCIACQALAESTTVLSPDPAAEEVPAAIESQLTQLEDAGYTVLDAEMPREQELIMEVYDDVDSSNDIVISDEEFDRIVDENKWR